ncbi:MAG: hypothetical protein ILA19_00720 [Bacilli bacterium]|nr:hypothetical protein [Bacilli bacterium]
MEIENKKGSKIAIIIGVLAVALVIGILVIVKCFGNSDSGDNGKSKDEKKNILSTKYKLIDYRVSKCSEVSDGVICLSSADTKKHEEVLIKFNKDNDIVWKKEVNEEAKLEGKITGSALSCNNEGMCAYGADYSNAPVASEQGMIILFNNQGDKVFEIKTDTYYTHLTNDIKIVEGGIVVTGEYYDKDKNDNYKGFVSKYDLNGKLLWKSTYDQEDEYRFNNVALASDGSIYVVGYTKVLKSNMEKSRGLLIKLDKTGQMIWKKEYEKDEIESSYHDILVNEKGEVFVLGTRDKEANALDQLNIFIKYDSTGKKISEKNNSVAQIEEIYFYNQDKIIGYGNGEDKEIVILNMSDTKNKVLLDNSKYDIITGVVSNGENLMIMTVTKESNNKTGIININNDELFK